MIRLTDPTRVGQALAEVRGLLGLSRRKCARMICEASGRQEDTVNSQLWTWDAGTRKPDLASLGPYLDVLDFDLALMPREDFSADERMVAAVRLARRELATNHPWIPGGAFRGDDRLKPLLLAFLDSLVPPEEDIGGYSPVRVPENTGKHSGESDESRTQ